MTFFWERSFRTHCQWCEKSSKAVGALVVAEEHKTSICDECVLIVAAKARETVLAQASEKPEVDEAFLTKLRRDCAEMDRLEKLTNEALVEEAVGVLEHDHPASVLLIEMMHRLNPHWTDAVTPSEPSAAASSTPPVLHGVPDVQALGGPDRPERATGGRND